LGICRTGLAFEKKFIIKKKEQQISLMIKQIPLAPLGKLNPWSLQLHSMHEG
jgi:hypothetical protein